MGMAACFASVDAQTLERLQGDPSSLEDFLFPNDGDGDVPGQVDVDKAWHGLHYLLTGCADGGPEPLAWAVLGGAEIGDDMGYGPARFLLPPQVRAVAEALSVVNESTLRSRYAPQAMEAADIYPSVIWVRDGEESFDYLLENFNILQTFYRDAAASGHGALLWLC
jgi:Domain of unknown function (DUF1877)